MISASRRSYYPREVEADDSPVYRGEGFLSDLCYAWEKEAKRCPEPTRLVITRAGVVLSRRGSDAANVTPVAGLQGGYRYRSRHPVPSVDSTAIFCRAVSFYRA